MFRTSLKPQFPSFLLYLLTILLPPTLTTPLSTPSILPVQNPSPPVSQPLSAILPPPNFSTDVSSITNNIPQRACFALTIDAFTSLAALSFDGHLQGAQQIRSPHFPGVRIRFGGPIDLGGLDVKYAVWGLTNAIQHMVSTYAYRESRFTLLWKKADVGMVEFLKDPPGGPGDTSTIGADVTFPHQPQSQNQTQNQTQTQTLHPVDNRSEAGSLGSELQYSATFSGRPVAFKDAMMAIIGGLTVTAVNDKDKWIDSRLFIGTFPSYGCKFILTTLEITPLPYYHIKSELLTGMLRASAMFYLSHQESRELKIVVLDGRDIIAAGALVLRDAGDISIDTLGTGRNNVSTS